MLLGILFTEALGIPVDISKFGSVSLGDGMLLVKVLVGAKEMKYHKEPVSDGENRQVAYGRHSTKSLG
jgi:hypothetical protein